MNINISYDIWTNLHPCRIRNSSRHLLPLLQQHLSPVLHLLLLLLLLKLLMLLLLEVLLLRLGRSGTHRQRRSEMLSRNPICF